MKKVFLSILTIGVLSTAMVACQSENKANGNDSVSVDSTDTNAAIIDTTNNTVYIAPTKEEIANTVTKAADFSNAEVNNALNEFPAIKEEFEKALKAKDDAAIEAVTAKYNAWVARTATLGAKLDAKENQSFIDYYSKLSQQWDIVKRQNLK